MHSYRLWRVLVIAIASLVLGIASAAILHAAGLGTRSGPTASSGPFPAAPGRVGPGMMGRYPAAPPSCAAPALPGTVVDVTLTDMGGVLAVVHLSPPCVSTPR